MNPEFVTFYVGDLKPSTAIRQGLCVGFTHKDLLLVAKITENESKDYLVPLSNFVFGSWSRFLELKNFVGYNK